MRLTLNSLNTTVSSPLRPTPASLYPSTIFRESTPTARGTQDSAPESASKTPPSWIEPEWQAAQWLPAGSAMAAEILHRDWSATSLGPIADWPACLRVAVCAVLDAPLPTLLLWGPELAQIYNDAYRPLLANRHPQALGQSAQACSPAAWPLHEPLYRRVLLAGECLRFDEGEFALESDTPPNLNYFASTCSPARDENGTVRGIVLVARRSTLTGPGWTYRDVGQPSAELLAKLFRDAPGFMAVFHGPDHVFQVTNVAYQTLIGQRAVLGRPLRLAVPEFASQGFLDLMDDAYTTGLPFVATAMAVQIQEPESNTMVKRYLDFVYQPIKDNAGHVLGMFVEGHDVTEQMLASAAWAQSHRDADDYLAMLYRR